METSRKKVVVQSVERALEILALFRYDKTISLTEISEQMGLAKSTVYGLMATLEKHGYLEQDQETGKYHLGKTLLELGTLFSERLDLRSVANPIMHELTEKHGETVQLTVLDGNKVFYIDRVEAPHSINISTRIGSRWYANCSASGKVMLADLSEKQLDELFDTDKLPTYTEKSISYLNDLKIHLKKIRELGYSYDNEEIESGLMGVAAGIRNNTGKVIAGLAISGPSIRIHDDEISILAKSVVEAANRISRKLGWQQ